MNGADQVAFEGSTGADNTPPYNVYQWSKDVTTLVAVAGEPMPGGGDYASASGNDGTFGQNDHGDISFTTALDTVTNGLNDTGAYVWSHGPLHLVARTGTVIPGVGTIARLGEFLNSNNGTNPPAYSMGEVINDRGQVFFTATLTDGTSVLLVATPAGWTQSRARSGASEHHNIAATDRPLRRNLVHRHGHPRPDQIDRSGEVQVS